LAPQTFFFGDRDACAGLDLRGEQLGWRIERDGAGEGVRGVETERWRRAAAQADEARERAFRGIE
jgi:hypothetical protein